MRRTWGSLLPTQKQREGNGKSDDNVHLFQWIYELWTFFMCDKWILFLTQSQNFKADWLWIMQMIRICWSLPTQEHKKQEGEGELELIGMAAFYVGGRRAEIKHFNYCQVHSFRKQPYDVQYLCSWSHFQPCSIHSLLSASLLLLNLI